jgi:SOS-response transcriptional repressor LexA
LEDGRVRLQPENKNMAPLYIENGDLRIIGKVVGVMRRLT